MASINHGTVRGYKAGCRCSDCKTANAEASRTYRANKAKREGKEPPRTSRPKAVPTTPKPKVRSDLDGPTGVDADREFERMRRQLEAGPIEFEARRLLEAMGDDAVTALRREVVFRAAQILDDPKKSSLFKDAANIVRAFLGDLLAARGAEGGEDDALASWLASLGSSRGRRNSAAMDDTAQSGA